MVGEFEESDWRIFERDREVVDRKKSVEMRKTIVGF